MKCSISVVKAQANNVINDLLVTADLTSVCAVRLENRGLVFKFPLLMISDRDALRETFSYLFYHPAPKEEKKQIMMHFLHIP